MDRELRSLRVSGALDAVWRLSAEDYGLFPELALDAARARAASGELEAATPRLLELVVGEREQPQDAAAVIAELGRHSWGASQRAALEEVLDAWWLEALMTEPADHRPPYSADVILGVIVGFGAPMVRWLEPWLAELDGPGAIHLGAMVLEGINGPAWAGKEDEAAQVLAWARTETVVNGLVMIGGTHLDEGVLGDLLDRLI